MYVLHKYKHMCVSVRECEYVCAYAQVDARTNVHIHSK